MVARSRRLLTQSSLSHLTAVKVFSWAKPVSDVCELLAFEIAEGFAKRLVQTESGLPLNITR